MSSVYTPVMTRLHEKRDERKRVILKQIHSLLMEGVEDGTLSEDAIFSLFTPEQHSKAIKAWFSSLDPKNTAQAFEVLQVLDNFKEGCDALLYQPIYRPVTEHLKEVIDRLFALGIPLMEHLNHVERNPEEIVP